MLTIEDLTVRYRTPGGEIEALSSISLAVAQGSTLALVGESGSGKSTVALAAIGLLPPEARLPSGRILFDGEDILTMGVETRRQLRGSRIGLVFQDPFSVLNPSLRIGDQVGEGLIHHRGFSPQRAFARAIELLDEVGIVKPEAVAQAYPHELSGGMRQRATIALATICRPDFIIADEPTTALDVVVQKDVLGMISSIQREIGSSVLFVTHDMGVHAHLTDRLGIMYAGRLIEEATTAEIFRAPRHPYTRHLIASLPRIGDDTPREGFAGAPPNLADPPPGCRFHPRCPLAMEVCSRSVPAMIGTAPGHRVACFAVTGSEEP
jgi:peptide/nickel transport system ATP-binding protein